jgi:hypothetical protein
MRAAKPAKLPSAMSWLFPEADRRTIRVDRDSRYILARVLEFGRMQDVAWCEGDPSLSQKTIALWRIALDARTEKWATSRRSRLHKFAPWPG